MSVRVPRRSAACEKAWAADPHGFHADPDHRYMAVEAFAAGWNAAISAYLERESDEENYSGSANTVDQRIRELEDQLAHWPIDRTGEPIPPATLGEDE